MTLKIDAEFLFRSLVQLRTVSIKLSTFYFNTEFTLLPLKGSTIDLIRVYVYFGFSAVLHNTVL